jgi:preprotein translocase subunit YajC
MLKLGFVFVVGLVITLVLIGGCAPAETSEEGGANLAQLLIFAVLIFGGMYFLMIRPQRRKQKEQKKIVDELRRGDKVITAGGIHGVIERVSEETVDLKVESGTIIRFARAAIHVKQTE